ncbi:glycosyltransferase family 4 protein [uncultured Paludibaculum sp.]|uniref:glycosyltransferase family 4 protein n=1 Tax=uncultured Paludibaculum sp. TaxID=1765020 RepID=UPI002AAC3C70|nr:glycosyltransferase family 4 protein [uncultured Paludibaculum sp.]
MRVRFVNQFFWPDEAATSQILTDLARAADCDVEVVCGAAGYAAATGEPGLAPKGVRVARVGTSRFGHGRLQKIASYAGFFGGAAWRMLTGPRVDLTVTMTTPPLLGLLGWAAQRWRGSRHFVWEMDVYPDVATALGTFRPGGVLDQAVGWLADVPRRRADEVISLGPCMSERLIRRGVRAERIFAADNWADGAAIQPLPFVSNGRLKVLYSGNAGLAHEFGTFQGAVERLAARDPLSGEQFTFRFGGGGPRMRGLRQWAEGRFPHVEFGGYAPRSELGRVFGWCDVGLVTQIPETCGAVVPSKTYGLLAAGRPVLYVGPKAATPARIIEKYRVGWQVDPGAVDELAALLVWLQAHPEEVEEAGARARVVFEREYDLPIGVARILDYLGIPVKAEVRAEAERRRAERVG